MKFLISAAFLMVCTFGYAQIPSQLNKEKIKVPKSGMFNAPPIESIIEMKSIDMAKIQKEDKEEEGMNVPFRFGVDLEVNLTTDNSGKWHKKEDGRVWKLKIRSKGALSINLIFNQLLLPEGAELYIYNEEKTMLYGPVTSNEISESGIFATDLIQGNTITLEIFEPMDKEGKSKVQISKIIHGYKDMFNTPNFYGDGTECTLDAGCSSGSTYQGPMDGTGMVILANGTRICSGALLNNVCRDYTPSFLTAFHCIDTGDNNNPCEDEAGNGTLSLTERTRAQNWVFRFQYKTNTCNGPEPTSSQWYSFSGATYRAGWDNSDFALVQMNQRPRGDVDTGIKLLGWSRATTAPTSGVSFHHPRGDVMKMSAYNSAAQSNANPINWNLGCQLFQRIAVSPANTHWSVPFYTGTTWGGSSGGPLFDQNNRVVGQLHGGANGCAPINKQYGRFDVSWNGGGNNTTRLSTWLTNNPNATSTNTVGFPYLSGNGLVCNSNTTFYLENAPSSTTHSVAWTVSSNLIVVSSMHNSIIVKYSGSGSGLGTVTASISNRGSACSVTTPFSRTIQVGPYSSSQIRVSGQSAVCSGNQYVYTATPAGSSYRWTYPSNWIKTSQAGNQITFNTPSYSTPDGGAVRVSITNACGASSYSGITVYPGYSCGANTYAIYPNPVNEQLTVEQVIEQDTISPSSEQQTEIASNEGLQLQEDFSIKLFDKNQNEVSSGKASKGKVVIDTRKLPKGYYYLNIFYKEEVLQKQILIEK